MSNALFLIHLICFELIYKSSLQNNSLLNPSGVVAPQAAPKSQDGQDCLSCTFLPHADFCHYLNRLGIPQIILQQARCASGFLLEVPSLEIHKASGTTLTTYKWKNAQGKTRTKVVPHGVQWSKYYLAFALGNQCVGITS